MRKGQRQRQRIREVVIVNRCDVMVWMFGVWCGPPRWDMCAVCACLPCLPLVYVSKPLVLYINGAFESTHDPSPSDSVNVGVVRCVDFFDLGSYIMHFHFTFDLGKSCSVIQDDPLRQRR